jgi:plastocyanin
MIFARKSFRLLLLPALAAFAITLAAVACGGDDDDENGGAETPSGNGGGLTTYNVLMNEKRGNVFEINGEYNPTMKVSAGQEITINLENNGSAIHNMRFGGEDKKYNTKDDAVSKPDIVSPGEEAVLVFTAPSDPGKYIYQCDFHPTDMLGEFEVVK